MLNTDYPLPKELYTKSMSCLPIAELIKLAKAESHLWQKTAKTILDAKCQKYTSMDQKAFAKLFAECIFDDNKDLFILLKYVIEDTNNNLMPDLAWSLNVDDWSGFERIHPIELEDTGASVHEYHEGESLLYHTIVNGRYDLANFLLDCLAQDLRYEKTKDGDKMRKALVNLGYIYDDNRHSPLACLCAAEFQFDKREYRKAIYLSLVKKLYSLGAEVIHHSSDYYRLDWNESVYKNHRFGANGGLESDDTDELLLKLEFEAVMKELEQIEKEEKIKQLEKELSDATIRIEQLEAENLQLNKRKEVEHDESGSNKKIKIGRMFS